MPVFSRIDIYHVKHVLVEYESLLSLLLVVVWTVVVMAPWRLLSNKNCVLRTDRGVPCALILASDTVRRLNRRRHKQAVPASIFIPFYGDLINESNESYRFGGHHHHPCSYSLLLVGCQLVLAVVSSVSYVLRLVRFVSAVVIFNFSHNNI